MASVPDPVDVLHSLQSMMRPLLDLVDGWHFDIYSLIESDKIRYFLWIFLRLSSTHTNDSRTILLHWSLPVLTIVVTGVPFNSYNNSSVSPSLPDLYFFSVNLAFLRLYHHFPLHNWFWSPPRTNRFPAADLLYVSNSKQLLASYLVVCSAKSQPGTSPNKLPTYLHTYIHNSKLLLQSQPHNLSL